jgi:membrane protein implicated in regulation of membrane protease activity
MRDWVKYSIVLAAVISFTGLVLHLHTLAWAGGVYAAGAVLYAFLVHTLVSSRSSVEDTADEDDEAVFE